MTAFFSWQHAIRSSKLESTTKLVCYTIWSHMASDGTGCFPSYALIADESGLSRRSVIEHVQKAAQAGFLSVDARQRENGSATSNMYRPTMPVGGEPAALGSERGSLGGGEPAAPPEETTLSNNPTNTPQPPRGPKGWERDVSFMKLLEAYSKLNPSRADPPKAWAVWQEQCLAAHADQILAALPSFAVLDQWRKEGGQFVPAMSKWLEAGAWRTAAQVDVQATAEALAERARIRTAGERAWAKIESCRRFNMEPEAEDVAALARWQELQQFEAKPKVAA